MKEYIGKIFGVDVYTDDSCPKDSAYLVNNSGVIMSIVLPSNYPEYRFIVPARFNLVSSLKDPKIISILKEALDKMRKIYGS